MAVERIPGGWRVRLRYGADQRGRFRMPDFSRDPLENERLARDRALRLERMARLLSTVSAAQAASVLTDAAAAPTESEFVGAERAAQAIASRAAADAVAPRAITFRDVCTLLLSGELARRFPDRSGSQLPQTLGSYRAPLERFCLVVGDIPVSKITVDDAERALASIPTEFEGSTRVRYAGLFARILNLAAFPLQIIGRSPLPEGWLPSAGPRRVFPFLYPEEDATLIECLRRRSESDASALNRAMLYGFLGREGLRVSEAFTLTWADLDLSRGAIRLDKNKTRTPRRWRLGDDVVAALRLRAEEVDTSPTERVFRPGFMLNHAASSFRADLSRCDILRQDLHEDTPERRMIRIHDLRGTFVTLALAAGRSEAWVMDRTGHTTSAMLSRYRSQARHAADIELGWFLPLDGLLWPGQAGAATSEFTEETRQTAKLFTDSPPDLTSQTPRVSGGAHGSAHTPEGAGPTHIVSPGLTGPVELALAAALEAATKAERWDVVLAVTAELSARRLARGGRA